MPDFLSVDVDLDAPKRLIVMVAAAGFVVSQPAPSGVAMWLLAAWYCREARAAHETVVAYRRLGGHLRKAQQT